MLKKCSIINKKYTLGNLSKTLIEHKQQTVHVETVCLLGKRKPDAKVKIGIDMDDYYRIRENAESK